MCDETIGPFASVAAQEINHAGTLECAKIFDLIAKETPLNEGKSRDLVLSLMEIAYKIGAYGGIEAFSRGLHAMREEQKGPTEGPGL